ncbi:HtaA domain-containing protein [Streptomyces sp. NPDC003247]|uniref:HtaA domain-containing protein n=1 Tax=Streptomyces sp. NPDC003247 TaxID=3364677 RepID=UPI0036917342
MLKRPGAVAALAAGALFALGCPWTAAATAVAVATTVAQDGAAGESREVSGGYVNWSVSAGDLAGRGVSLAVTAPASRAAGQARFPAVDGTVAAEGGSADVGLGGAARLGGPADRPLVLAGLRLELAGGEGALHARTVVDGRARELELAEVAASGAGPAVRAAGVTWTGLRAVLTEEGAALLSAWSGSPFAVGDGLGAFDVTVGTASGAPSGTVASDAPGPASGTAAGGSPQTAAGSGASQPAGQGKPVAPAAAVARATLAAGGEQTVTGTGFTPGAVVLVAIDGDTRYQAVADAGGDVGRTFPVYAGAVEGEHTVELTAVSGERAVVSARFEVEAPH